MVLFNSGCNELISYWSLPLEPKLLLSSYHKGFHKCEIVRWVFPYNTSIIEFKLQIESVKIYCEKPVFCFVVPYSCCVTAFILCVFVLALWLFVVCGLLSLFSEHFGRMLFWKQGNLHVEYICGPVLLWKEEKIVKCWTLWRVNISFGSSGWRFYSLSIQMPWKGRWVTESAPE